MVSCIWISCFLEYRLFFIDICFKYDCKIVLELKLLNISNVFIVIGSFFCIYFKFLDGYIIGV